MKLISCYIEAYGAIKQKSYNFNTPLTNICEDNGYGKTTLTSFIKAMFYGLDTYKANSKTFSDRQHFYPFDGGNFGGNLTFERNGKTYKIERFFDEKSDTKDSLNVYCNGSKTLEFGDEIGKSIFGIDKQSFERTISIDSNEIEISSTSDINAKLNTFIQGNIETNNFDEAIDKLEKINKNYKKSRTGASLIDQVHNNLNSINERIANLETIKKNLIIKNKEYDKLSQVIKEKEQEQRKINSLNSINKDWEHYDSLINETNLIKEKINTINDNYPNGLPTEEEVTKAKQVVIEKKQLENSNGNVLLSDTEKDKFNTLSGFFINGVPSDDEISEIKNNIKAFEENNYAIKTLQHTATDENYISLKNRFDDNLPNDEQISDIEEKINEYKALTSITNVTTSEVNVAPTYKKPLLIVLSILGLLLIISGITLLFILQIVGIILLVLSVLDLFVLGFVYLLNKMNLNNKNNISIPQTNTIQTTELFAEISAFLSKYSYFGNEIISNFTLLKIDINTYKNSIITNEQQIKERIDKNKEINNIFKDFFNEYCISFNENNPIDTLNMIFENISEFKKLKEQIDKEKTINNTKQSLINEKSKLIEEFFNKYNLKDITLDNVLTNIVSLRQLNNSLKEKIDGAIRFKNEKNLIDRPNETNVDIDLLSDELEKLRSEQAALRHQISDDEIEVEKLDDLLNQKERNEELLKEYKNKNYLFSETINSLKTADQNLKDKYIKPIKDEFIKYSKPLEEALTEKISMDKDFKIYFEKNGKERSERHLSSGQRSICALCFRLALISNMYLKEKPFIIMDDPFAYLDEKYFEKVSILLKDICKDMQIIYFTCHPSRNLNSQK